MGETLLIQQLITKFLDDVLGLKEDLIAVFNNIKVKHPDLAATVELIENEVLPVLDANLATDNFLELLQSQIDEIKSGQRGSDPQHPGMV